MKAGNGAGFAPGSTRARKRDDVRRRVDATRDMRNFVSTIPAVFFATHSHIHLDIHTDLACVHVEVERVEDLVLSQLERPRPACVLPICMLIA
jgi:hypothetical protein